MPIVSRRIGLISSPSYSTALLAPAMSNPHGSSAFTSGQAKHLDRISVAGLDQGQGLFLVAHPSEGCSDRLRRERGVASGAVAAVLLLRHRNGTLRDRQWRQRRASDVLDALRQPVEDRHHFAERLHQCGLFGALIGQNPGEVSAARGLAGLEFGAPALFLGPRASPG